MIPTPNEVFQMKVINESIINQLMCSPKEIPTATVDVTILPFLLIEKLEEDWQAKGWHTKLEDSQRGESFLSIRANK